MKRTPEVDQYLNDRAASRNSLIQYEVLDERGKKLISWYLISMDIDEMIACINQADAFTQFHPVPFLVISALWEKMIVSYGKIFLKSDNGYASLPDNIIDRADLPLHEAILKIRHSYLAHRGENDLEHHKLILSVEGTEDNCHIQFIVPWTKLQGQYGNTVVTRRYLKRLKKKVLQRLGHMRNKYELKIFEELGLTSVLE